MDTTHTNTILVVEDSPEDFRTIVRGFEKAGLSNPVHWCRDGQEAMDHLFGVGGQRPGVAARPAVVLLDLSLPGADGQEVLAAIKDDDSLCQVPVIILTSSSDERDIETCYRLGANSYVRKPVSIAGFVEAIVRLKDYWFEISVFPCPSETAHETEQ